MHNIKPNGYTDAYGAANEYAAYFATKNYQLHAIDLAKTLTTPATNDALLNDEIGDIFNTLRHDGATNPILIGAFPFDNTQASSLNIYRHYKKHPKEAIQELNKPTPITIKHKTPLVDQKQFENTVEQALALCAANTLQKIVLSQAVDVEFIDALSPLVLVEVLAKQNPDAYTFAIPVTGNQFIIGASPELLLSKQERNVISNPLAGSRPQTIDNKEKTHRKKELQQAPKDRHEHWLVMAHVAKKLAPYCFELSISEYPEILETATMLHLSSILKGQLRSNAPNALNLALQLHPTPAVCGTPTQIAKKFIIDNEGYDRNYYAGLVGWMDGRGNGEWVVTIRCGLMQAKSIRLYAGAGIVSGSDANMEWHETQAKMKTMFNAFNI